ncbi:uncharacterized protein LOC144118493 isoform X1 [Amblyomma americanum]
MIFGNVGCNECNELPIIDARWKCSACLDYGLCTACYLTGKHSPEHSFVRIDAPGVEGMKVASKQQSQKVPGYTFPEVAVAWLTTTLGNTFLANMGRLAVRRASSVRFGAVKCDSCGQQEFLGRRWKCAVCVNYDLCTNCHWAWKHCLDHAFLRIDEPGATA